MVCVCVSHLSVTSVVEMVSVRVYSSWEQWSGLASHYCNDVFEMLVIIEAEMIEYSTEYNLGDFCFLV